MTTPPAPPPEAVATLTPPDVRGDVTASRHPDAVEVWNGIVWSRLGRGDLAWAWWDRVGAVGLGPWVAAERGRVVRELGLHDEAERYERFGLEQASDIVDVVMLRIGLTADAVGQGDIERAGLRLEAVTALLGTLDDSPRVARQRLRRSWVAVEVAYLAGDEPDGEGLPRWGEDGPVMPEDYEHGSDFHRAKGLLFGGIVHDDLRLLEAAAETAPPVLVWAIELARADRDDDGAMERARESWQALVPPPGYGVAVARTATAERLRGPRKRSV